MHVPARHKNERFDEGLSVGGSLGPVPPFPIDLDLLAINAVYCHVMLNR